MEDDHGNDCKIISDVMMREYLASTKQGSLLYAAVPPKHPSKGKVWQATFKENNLDFNGNITISTDARKYYQHLDFNTFSVHFQVQNPASGFVFVAATFPEEPSPVIYATLGAVGCNIRHAKPLYPTFTYALGKA
ncbi:hypothetical protein CBS101457_003329 [Exobasidium rhododendri]|nr:hypothetical protein CBS101457_003329 [Exobasidium rhododendri]